MSSGLRPNGGLYPTAPAREAGILIEPPPSVPSASVVIPPASAAPAPPEEPPGVYSRFHGLRVMPQSGLAVMPACANSGVVVRQCMIAPESSNRWTVGAVLSGR